MALVEELATAGRKQWIDPAAAVVVDRARLRSRSRRVQEDAERWTEGSTTRYALDAGRAGENGWSEAEVLEALAEPLALAAKGELQTSSPDILAPDWLGSRARLDVRSLRSAGLLKVEELRAAALRWDRDTTGIINYVLMAADFRDPNHPYVLTRARDTFDGVDYFQTIPIEHCAARWYFRCPISGSRRTTLYLREGLFGSDKALNLRKREWDASEDPAFDPNDEDLWSDVDDDEEDDGDYPV